MSRVKSSPFSGQVPNVLMAFLLFLSIVSCATLSRRDQHIFELAQVDSNRQISTSASDPTAQFLGAFLGNEAADEGSWRNTELAEPSTNGPMVYAASKQGSNLGSTSVTKIVTIEEQGDEPDIVHVQRSWLDRHPKSRNLIATGIMGSAIAYALTSVRKASHMDPVPESVQNALAMVNPVAKPTRNVNQSNNIKRESDLDSPSFVKRAHGRWRAGALGMALGGFGMYIHSNKLGPDIKEALWPSRNSDNGNGKRSITEIIFLRDDEEEDEHRYLQKREGGKNLAYPVYASAAAVGLYGLHKYSNGGFQTQGQTTMQKRSVIPEEGEKEEIKLQRRGRGWKDANTLNARTFVSPSHKQVKVYWKDDSVDRFDRQTNNPNGDSAGDEQGNWRPVQSFGARAFVLKDRGQVKIIWKSGNVTFYNRNSGGNGGPIPSSNTNNNNNKTSDDFDDHHNGAFASIRMRGHQGCSSFIWLIVLALTVFLTLGSVSAEGVEAFDGLPQSQSLEKRQFIFRRANSTPAWLGVHDLNAESKISPSHTLVKVIWHSGNVTTYNRADGQSPPVLPTMVLPDDEPVLWRTVGSFNAKTQLSTDHEQLRVLWNSGNITNFTKLPPNPPPAPAPAPASPSPPPAQQASNPVQNRSQINNGAPLQKPNNTNNDFDSNQSNNATISKLRSKAGGSVGFAGLLLFWCVLFLFPGDVLTDERTGDRINSADLAKRSNVLLAQTSTDSMAVIERSKSQAGEEEGIALVRRGPYKGWTPFSAIPAKSWISPRHDQLKMIRLGEDGPEFFIREQDARGTPLPPNNQWQRLRDINAKARLSPDENRVAVRWNSGSITEYIRRETLRKRSLPGETSTSTHLHRYHRRHVAAADHDHGTHEHTAKDFQLGRISPPSHHASYDQRTNNGSHDQKQNHGKHHKSSANHHKNSTNHKNSASSILHRRGFGMELYTFWIVVLFTFSVLFFASVSNASGEEIDLASSSIAKRSVTQLSSVSTVSTPSLTANVPLHFNSVQVNSIPHSTIDSLQGYKSNTARKALRDSHPQEQSQVEPTSRKSRLRQKRGPGKSKMMKREVGEKEKVNEKPLLKRSIATVSSSAPSNAPISSTPFANSQSSTAFTQDNWPDGNPGKPSRPRNSVAIHDEFVLQYGRKDGLEDPRRDLKGGGGARGGGSRGTGARGGVRGGGGYGGGRRGGRGSKSDSAGSNTKNAALMAGGAAAGTAIALYEGGKVEDNARPSKKNVGSAESRSKKSRLRKQMMSTRSLEDEESSLLFTKRALQTVFKGDERTNESVLIKRSVAQAPSTFAPSSAPINSSPFANSQSSTAFTQDNWPDGNPGKPSRPRNSVAVHDEFVRQYGSKEGTDNMHRELRGSSGGGGGHSGSGHGSGTGSSSTRSPPGYCRTSTSTNTRRRHGDCDDSNAGKSKTKSAALIAAGAAAGTAMALYHDGGGGGEEDASGSKKKSSSANTKSRKSRLRKQMLSERSKQSEDHPMLLVKRSFQSSIFAKGNKSFLKRSVVSNTSHGVPISQSILPSVTSRSSLSSLPKNLADQHSDQLNQYESIAKEYPVSRKIFDEKKASVRDSQLPHGTINNRKMLRTNDQQAASKSGKSTAGAVSAGLALTAYGGAAVSQAMTERLIAKSRKGGTRGRRIARLATVNEHQSLDKRSAPDLSSIILKRSIMPYTAQTIPVSEPNLPSVATSSTSSGLPRSLADHHVDQVNQYESIAKKYPVSREMFDRKKASVRDSQLPTPSNSDKVRSSGQVVRDKKSHAITTALVATGAAGVGAAEVHRRMRKAVAFEKKGGVKKVQFAGIDKRSIFSKRTYEVKEFVENESSRLLPRINSPTGKMEKALLIGSSGLLAAGSLVATKAVLTPPDRIREKRNLDSIESTTSDILIERSPISAGAKNIMIGLGSAAAAGGLTLHLLNKDAIKKDKGYGVGKIPDQIW